MGDKLITRAEAAEYLQVPHRTLDDWALRGKGPRYYKLGRHARYRLEDLNAWLETQVAS